MEISETRSRLIRLQAEHFQARELGVESPSPYMTRLEAAIAEARVEYIVSAVREIAVLRGSLIGAAHG